jgi:hypothetical protein
MKLYSLNKPKLLRSVVVVWGTMLQAGRLRVRISPWGHWIFQFT